MKEPTTPQEWQDALDAVVALLDQNGTAARKYGVVTLNVARCGEILRRATALGYIPTKQDRVRLLLPAFAAVAAKSPVPPGRCPG